MDYLYPPIYKYIAFFTIIFLFMEFYKSITPDKYLFIALLFTLLVFMLDFMMIANQGSLTDINDSASSDSFYEGFDDEFEDNRKMKINRDDDDEFDELFDD